MASFRFLIVPPGPPFPEPLHNQTMCGIVWCYTGQPEQAEATFKPMRSFRPPALDLVGPLPHPALQGMFDALYPPGLQWYWRADFVNELSDCSYCTTRQVWLGNPDAPLNHAPLPDQRRGAPGGQA